MKDRSPTYTFADGWELARVPIARDGKQEAVIHKADYLELIGLGLSGNWFLIRNTVCARVPGGKTILVARAILDAQPGTIIKYLDGDGKNLRRDNLKVMNGGFSVNADRRLLLEAKEQRKAP